MKQDLMESFYWSAFKWARNGYAGVLEIWSDSLMIEWERAVEREFPLEFALYNDMGTIFDRCLSIIY